MHRPYEEHTRDELAAEFAAAVRLGGRPMVRKGAQYSYADLALEIILEEFRRRADEERYSIIPPSVVEMESEDVPF